MKTFYTRKFVMAFVCALGATLNANASKTIYSFDVVRPVTKVNTDPTIVSVNTTELTKRLKLTTDIESSLSSGKAKFYALQGANGAYYGTTTYSSGGHGHWFTDTGFACRITSSSARLYSTFSVNVFKIGHLPDRSVEGDKYSFAQAFVNGTDTVEYQFRVTIGQTEGYTTDQPIDTGRPDITEGWNVIPYVQKNDGAKIAQNYIQVMEGDKITLSAETITETANALFSWYPVDTLSQPNLKKALKRVSEDSELVLTESAKLTDGGAYMLRAIVPNEGTSDCYFFVDVQTKPKGTPYLWEEHTPRLSYDFRTEYPNLKEPQNILPAEGNIKGRYSDRWWTFIYGPNKRSLVTEKAWKPMLERFNKDFGYMRDEMGWPADKRARSGYKSTICMYGSGLTTDNMDSTALGGWQGSTWYAGSNWPMVLISYYPIYSFDPSCPYGDREGQMGAMIHEGIHCLLADYEGCKNAAWFQEAGNTWLQQEMEAKRTGVYGVPGFLDPSPFVAPFMPVECYSGWLQDGSFGGPSAEGVNMFNDKGQVCTWRNLLGGTQYANGFAVFMGANVGQTSVAWIWRYCKSRVLDGIADSIGDYQTRQLIMQYRAKQATMDLGPWSNGYRTGLNNNFGITIKAEWEPYWINVKPWIATPYQTVVKNGQTDWYAPDTLTCPGWSGGNQIPLHVEGDTVEVEFKPQGPGMMFQLCYRTKAGKTYYSQPVNCGTASLALKEKPANGIVFAVVANTDYVYLNDATRKKHHDYRLAFGKGVKSLASTNQRWYFYENTINDPGQTDVVTSTGDLIADEEEVVPMGSSYGVQITNGMIRPGDLIRVKLNGVDEKDVDVHIVGLGGLIADKGKLSGQAYRLPANTIPGMYVVTFSHNGKEDAFKIYVTK